jgi:hypothetical protein
MAVNYTFDAYETTVSRTDTNLADGSAKMWNGYSDGPVQENYTKFFQDGKDWNSGASWTVTEVGTSLQTEFDGAGGGIKLITGGTENDGITIQQGKGNDSTGGEWVLPQVGKNIYFEMKGDCNTATQVDLFIGLATTDTAITSSFPNEFIGFLKIDGETGWACRTSTGAVITATTNVATLDTNVHKYGIKITGITKVEFYIDDAIVATHTTNIPSILGTSEMRPTFEILAGDGNARTFTMRNIRVAAQN